MCQSLIHRVIINISKYLFLSHSLFKVVFCLCSFIIVRNIDLFHFFRDSCVFWLDVEYPYLYLVPAFSLFLCVCNMLRLRLKTDFSRASTRQDPPPPTHRQKHTHSHNCTVRLSLVPAVWH